MNLRPRTQLAFLSFAAAFSGALPLPAQSPAQGNPAVLTLEEAVHRTLAYNPDLAVDIPAMEAARSQIAVSRAGYFPNLNFDQSYTGSNNPVFVFGTRLSQRRFTAADFELSALNNPEAIDNLKTSVSAQQMIWDFGRTGDQVKAARQGLEVSEHSHQQHLQQVLLQLYESYYSVSLARNALETARLSVKTAEAIVEQAKSRVQSGVAVEADLLRSQVYLANMHQNEIEAMGNLENAQAALNRTMGASLSETVGQTTPLTPVAIPLPSPAELAAEQKLRRPEYLRMQAEVRRAELNVSSHKSNFLPFLGGFAGWEMDNPSLDDYGGSNWTAGVDLRWNLSTGGAEIAQIHVARYKLEEARRRLTALESAMALELHQAFVRVRSAAQQVEAMKAAEAQSEESLRILQNRYDAGLATITDLLSAETARASARTALSNAIYRHRTSFARLEFAAGILSPTSKAMNP